MTEPLGLRERKKLRTHAAISDAAIALFMERGFDAVPVAEVAAAAEVSKRTLFAYFPTKEDLVVHRFADHQNEGARVVADRPTGQSALNALEEHFVQALAERDPSAGLTDVPHIVGFYRMITETPALNARLYRFNVAGGEALAQALIDTADTEPMFAMLAAAQLVSVRWTLAQDNIRKIEAGATADELYPAAVRNARRAYTMLREGLGTL